MRLFYKYLRDFIKEDFQVSVYMSAGIFAAAVITLNFSIDLEDGIIDRLPNYLTRVAAFFALYTGIYLSVILIKRVFQPDISKLLTPSFWMKVALVFLVLAIDIAFKPSSVLHALPFEIRFYVGKVLGNFISLLTMLAPFALFYYYFDRWQPSFYGLTSKGFVLKPYLYLFTIIIPLVIVGSFLPGFQQQYPMYVSTSAHEYYHIPEWLNILIYEIAYGWNFVTIELLFRGFLVIGMVQLIGRHAILPMAIVYSSIHFGKPLGECISSIFGGYFLGTIAYYSRNIWGGVVIHVGLAWLMEIISSLHDLLMLKT